MLAQNFMTAEALGITEEQHTALVKTLGFFERGEVPPEKFDMRYWCGTACCIGGWVEQLTGVNIDMGEPASIQPLCYPETDALFCTDPAKGAHALRNYLTRGDADWRSVMAGG